MIWLQTFAQYRRVHQTRTARVERRNADRAFPLGFFSRGGRGWVVSNVDSDAVTESHFIGELRPHALGRPGRQLRSGGHHLRHAGAGYVICQDRHFDHIRRPGGGPPPSGAMNPTTDLSGHVEGPGVDRPSGIPRRQSRSDTGGDRNPTDGGPPEGAVRHFPGDLHESADPGDRTCQPAQLAPAPASGRAIGRTRRARAR